MSNYHLGIYAQRLHGKRTGVARYLINLLEQWHKQFEELPFERITLYSRSPLPEDIATKFPKFEQVSFPSNLPQAIWEHFVFPRYVNDVDVLFCPAYIVPLTYRGRCVVTTHDMIQVLRPYEFPVSSRLRSAPLYRFSARRADYVLTDAKASVNLIHHHYNVPKDNIFAVQLAATEQFSANPQPQDASVLSRLNLPDVPFVLFTGKLSVRRHIPDLIAAFSLLKLQNGLPHQLLLVGPNQLDMPIEDLIQKHDLVGRIHNVGFISDDDLASLYRQATVFCYPSEMEGFGLPVLESMQSGTPVVTLKRPVLEEVGSDAVKYAKSGDAQHLYEALYALLSSEEQRDRFRVQGLSRASHFSWQRAARETMDILAHALTIS